MHNWDKSLKLLKKAEVPNQELSMEQRQEEEHLGSQESILVPKSSLEIKLSVILPKSMLENSGMITEDSIEHSMLQLGRTIGKHWSTLMMESYREHGMRTTNILDYAELVSPELPLEKTLMNTTIKDLET